MKKRMKITFEQLVSPALVFNKGVLSSDDISRLIGNFNINLGEYFDLVDQGLPILSKFVDYDGYIMKIKERYSLGYFINEEQTLADILFMISNRSIILYLNEYFKRIKKEKEKIKGMK